MDLDKLTETNRYCQDWSRGMMRWLVLAPMAVAVALCYWFQDFYPLSHFPMYSQFDDRTYYVYLKGKDGEAIATRTNFRIYTSDLKKHYGRDLKVLKKELKGSHFDWTEAQKWKAGMATLEYLKNERSPKAFANGAMEGLTLIDVRIHRAADGKLEKREDVVGRIGP